MCMFSSISMWAIHVKIRVQNELYLQLQGTKLYLKYKIIEVQIKGGASDGFPHMQTYKNHLNKKPLTNDVYLPNEAHIFTRFYVFSKTIRGT